MYACNIEVSKAMEKCKTDLAETLKKLRVEVVDAAKRARAAAAVEGALYLGNLLFYNYFISFITLLRVD